MAQAHEFTLGRAIGYVPFFDGLRPFCWAATPRAPSADLAVGVDEIDDQRCVVQSSFVFDLASDGGSGARTWGQVFTGELQVAIGEALNADLPVQ